MQQSSINLYQPKCKHTTCLFVSQGTVEVKLFYMLTLLQEKGTTVILKIHHNSLFSL